MVKIKKFIESKFPNLFQKLKRIKESLFELLGNKYPWFADLDRRDEGIEKYAFPTDGNVMQDLMNKFGSTGDLAQLYSSEGDSIVHKWHHYITIYERYFEKYRGQKIRFLEIGVSKGGSLRMWREYFSPEAIVFGIDIDENCFKLNGVHAEVRIGS